MATVKNDTSGKFNFNFTEQTTGIADENDLSAIIQTAPLDLSLNNDVSFDMKLIQKMGPSESGALDKIEEESQSQSQSEVATSGHENHAKVVQDNKVFDDDFALEI